MSTTDPWPPKGLGRPAQRALANADIASFSELAARTEREVGRLHGMGPNGLKVLRAALSAHGLAFAAP